jgi:hypothetical protein
MVRLDIAKRPIQYAPRLRTTQMAFLYHHVPNHKNRIGTGSTGE